MNAKHRGEMHWTGTCADNSVGRRDERQQLRQGKTSYVATAANTGARGACSTTHVSSETSLQYALRNATYPKQQVLVASPRMSTFGGKADMTRTLTLRSWTFAIGWKRN